MPVSLTVRQDEKIYVQLPSGEVINIITRKLVNSSSLRVSIQTPNDEDYKIWREREKSIKKEES
jgi:hypothetical protein